LERIVTRDRAVESLAPREITPVGFASSSDGRLSLGSLCKGVGEIFVDLSGGRVVDV
jgi:hypothetical protein